MKRLYIQGGEVGPAEFEDSGDFELISRTCYIFVFDAQDGSCPVWVNTIAWEFGPEQDYHGDIFRLRGMTWDGDNFLIVSEHDSQEGENGDFGYPVFWVDLAGNLVAHKHIFWRHKEGLDYAPYLVRWIESRQEHWVANSLSDGDTIFVTDKDFNRLDTFDVPPPPTSSQGTSFDQGLSMVEDGVIYGSYYDGTDTTGGNREYWERGIDVETREVVEEHNWGVGESQYYLHGMARAESQLYGVRFWEEDEIYLLQSDFPFDFQQTCVGYYDQIPEKDSSSHGLFGGMEIFSVRTPPLRFQQRDDWEFANNPNDPRVTTGGQAPTTRQNSIRHSRQTYW